MYATRQTRLWRKMKARRYGAVSGGTEMEMGYAPSYLVPQVSHSAPSGISQKMLRQMLHTKPVSTTLRWQKQAARKSTMSALGGRRLSASSRLEGAQKPNMRYESRPCGFEAARKVPRVMKAACWRKVALPCSESTSMAMPECEAAKTAFMVGMYCEADESETEMTRMRACKPMPSSTAAAVFVVLVAAFVLVVGRERAVLLMCARASVSAPATSVVVWPRSFSDVEDMRSRSDLSRLASISENWGNLLAELRVAFPPRPPPAPPSASTISTSSPDRPAGAGGAG